MINLALRRTFGAVLLSGAALALSTAAAMPAEAATTVKVSGLGNTASVVGTTARDVITFNGSTASLDVSTDHSVALLFGA